MHIIEIMVSYTYLYKTSIWLPTPEWQKFQQFKETSGFDWVQNPSIWLPTQEAQQFKGKGCPGGACFVPFQMEILLSLSVGWDAGQPRLPT